MKEHAGSAEATSAETWLLTPREARAPLMRPQGNLSRSAAPGPWGEPVEAAGASLWSPPSAPVGLAEEEPPGCPLPEQCRSHRNLPSYSTKTPRWLVFRLSTCFLKTSVQKSLHRNFTASRVSSNLTFFLEYRSPS